MVGVNTDQVVADIKAALKRKQKPDLKSLTNWVWESLNPCPYPVWEEIKTAIIEAYGISEDEFSRSCRTPMLAKAASFKDDFTPILDKTGVEGFLRDYLEHTKEMEAPTPFHFFNILTVLGASLRRNIWIDQGYYQIFPALQTIIVGPSQKVKKSTAASYAVAIGEDSNRINRLMDEGTQEALKSELAELYEKEKQACGIIYSSELATLLGEKDYNRDLVQTFTDLFDSRLSMRRRTRSQGDVLIRNIAVSFLGCSNERWLRTSIPVSAFEGGFMARVLLIWCGGTDRYSPRPKPPTDGAREKLVQFLMRTAFVKGEAVLSASAEEFYVSHYRHMKDNWPEDERLNPFWERYPDHMLRLGMLLSVSQNVEQRERIDITHNHLLQAKGILDWILRQMPKLYSILGMTQFGDEAMEIINFIYGHTGAVTEGALRRKMLKKMGHSRLNEHIKMLIDAKMIFQRRSQLLDGDWEYILLREPGEL